MKKLLVLVGMSVLLFFSCATKVGIVFDDSVPLEQTTQIYTYNIGSVTAYNGVAVGWKQKVTMETIQIPAGETQLVWDIKTTSGNTNYTGKNMVFVYNFQPGKNMFLCLGRKRIKNMACFMV